jgi:RNA polymerase sigma-70 factor (ECF subfamily)
MPLVLAEPRRTAYVPRPVEDVTALVLAARSGDPTALSSFVRSTWNEVARLVTAVAGRDLAEDATQDAYLRAIKALPSYRGEASGRTWLLSIARRAAIDAVRGAARRRRLADRLMARTEVRATVDIAVEDLTLTEQLLAGLDQDRRTAFALTQLLGLSYAEAADVCGCPVGTIRSRVARARDDLIRHLGPGAVASP